MFTRFTQQLTLALTFFLVCSFSVKAQSDSSIHNGLTWYTNINKAHQLSKTTHKPIFAFFTGSDWCGWCKKLQRDVFDKPEFLSWAKKNVILLELDFPRGKQLPPEQMQQNYSLQQTFQVQGYPTIWMFFMEQDAKTQQFSITALGSLGYPQGSTPGKEEVKFLSDANTLLAHKPN